MIPQISYSLVDIDFEEQPSYTYRMDIEKSKIIETCDNLEAVKQAVYKILNTERYQCLLYSWNYGIELQNLLGMPVGYCLPEIERRITEALLQDDRIIKVYGFKFDTLEKGAVHTYFTVETKKGSFEAEKKVVI